MGKRDGLRMRFHNSMRLDESTPGWQDRVIENLASKEKFLGPAADPKYPRFYIHAGQTLTALMPLAAERRGLSKSTYIRRAIAAFVAHDLEQDFAEVLKDGPSLVRYAHRSGYGAKRRVDDGKGHGPWEIEQSE